MDFPRSAMALLEVLLAVEPDRRGTASSALQSEVIMAFLAIETLMSLSIVSLFCFCFVFLVSS